MARMHTYHKKPLLERLVGLLLVPVQVEADIGPTLMTRNLVS